MPRSFNGQFKLEVLKLLPQACLPATKARQIEYGAVSKSQANQHDTKILGCSV